MIRQNELRVGDWVLSDADQIEIGQAWMIDESSLFDPIPLSTGILEKCGFEKLIQGNIDFYEIGDFSIEWWGEYFLFTDGCLSTKIYYLHQLQNLYFALTGEELKVNL